MQIPTQTYSLINFFFSSTQKGEKNCQSSLSPLSLLLSSCLSRFMSCQKLPQICHGSPSPWSRYICSEVYVCMYAPAYWGSKPDAFGGFSISLLRIHESLLFPQWTNFSWNIWYTSWLLIIACRLVLCSGGLGEKKETITKLDFEHKAG